MFAILARDVWASSSESILNYLAFPIFDFDEGYSRNASCVLHAFLFQWSYLECGRSSVRAPVGWKQRQ